MGLFSKTRLQNLWRYRNGTYYVRVRVGGRREVMRSLETDLESIARKKLPRKLAEILAEERRLDRGDFTLKECADIYLAGKRSEAMNPRAYDYRVETVAMLRRTWPGFDEVKATEVSPLDCQRWAIGAKGYVSERTQRPLSGGRFNGMVESLRGILKVAVQGGALEKNPALEIKRVELKRKVLKLPAPPEFRALLVAMQGNQFRRLSVLAVRFIVFSGQRPTAAGQVCRRDVDLERNEISFPPIKHNDERLVVPMSTALRRVTRELLWFNRVRRLNDIRPGRRTHGQRREDLPLVPMKNPHKALAHACRDLGMTPLTRNGLRHLFTTHCLEQGLAIEDVARLRGDKDGGAMLLKTYVHPREKHLQKQVARVKW